jgi:hypothetical protein
LRTRKIPEGRVAVVDGNICEKEEAIEGRSFLAR